MPLSEDLRNRTKRFASDIIQSYVTLPKRRKEVEILGTQTAQVCDICNAREASRARSDSEFCSKLDGLLQEADESQLWIELLRDDCAIRNGQLAHLYSETDELLAILSTIVAEVRREQGEGKSETDMLKR
jgi:four helix bundle protein